KWIFPNGGEFIWEDTLITWTSSGVNNVNIDYTEDNGQNWNPVVSNFPSTGAYYWHLPIVPPATLARLRVTDASDPTVTDMSDNPFNLWIKAAIKLDGPIGNHPYSSLEGINISWKAIDVISSVKIEYSIDNGKSWNIIAQNIPSTRRQVNNYMWKGVPQNIKGNILIKLSDSKGRYSDKSGKITLN
ncbi:MAG: hypothetical protein P4L35_11065, partial [Ignavibacteriaceae bacterium]|nr:hypothetical protein [Ignavibacteriaceae bacterium]